MLAKIFMTPFIMDLVWILAATSLAWLIFEKKKPKAEQSNRSALTIGFISWFAFKFWYRGVITTKGATQVDALLVGALFGGITLLICLVIRWILTRKKGG